MLNVQREMSARSTNKSSVKAGASTQAVSDSVAGANSMVAMSGMKGMAADMPADMQAHMQQIGGATGKQMLAMLPTHRQLVANMLEDERRDAKHEHDIGRRVDGAGKFSPQGAHELAGAECEFAQGNDAGARCTSAPTRGDAPRDVESDEMTGAGKPW